MKACLLAGAIILVLATVSGAAGQAPPIIDMHLHAEDPAEFLQHRLNAPTECALPREIPPLDTAAAKSGDLAGSYFKQRLGACTRRLNAATTEAELIQRTLAILQRRNIVAVASSSFENVQKWRAASPSRILPGLLVFDPKSFSPEIVRAQVARNEIKVLGEIAPQYLGLSPDDSQLEPIFALAEELDVPVGIHIGLSAPGVPIVTLTTYRASASRPLELEQVLLKHPRLRLYVMHAGWPMLDEMLHVLWSFPQVYVDIAAIDWLIPQQEFHAYLKRLIDAGFGKRIMFGSDQMVWPDAIEAAIDNVNAAPFLTAEQKRDIFYNNAVRFLRLDSGGSASR